ncbi:MAG: acyl-CoA dehydrogenase family protein [Micrococcaceae bacterium]
MLASDHDPQISQVLTPELLDRLYHRAPEHDEANAFPSQDLEDLAASGYLAAFAPADQGGLGWHIDVVSAAQRRLAAAAPATALAVNMHLVWGGVARILADQGDESLAFILEESARGEIFAFGISEPGNDSVLFDSSTVATPDGAGGYTFSGTKIFTTLSPVWTRLGIFGKTPDGEQLVFGMLDRAAGGTEADPSSWDMLGMRATQSYATRLNEAPVPAQRIMRHIPTGPNQDGLTFGIFASFLTLIGSVYAGIADRALHLAADAAEQRTQGATGVPLSQDPVTRHRLGEAALQAIGLDAQLTQVASALSTGKEWGAEWFPRLVVTKTLAVRLARSQVEVAMQMCGGQGFHRSHEISRLYRDVVAGAFHPSNEDSAHRTLATFIAGPLRDDADDTA